MEEDNQLGFEFPGLGRRKIEANFAVGQVSSDGGVMLSLLVAAPVPVAALQLRLRFIGSLAPAWPQIHGIGSCSSGHHPAQVA